MRTDRQCGAIALVLAVGSSGVILAVGGGCGEIAGLRDPVTRGDQPPGSSGDGSATTPEGVEIAPTSLELDDLACGAAAETAKAITLTNTSDAAIDFEARLPDGAVFYLKTDNASPPPASSPPSSDPVLVSGTIKAHDVTFLYVGARSQTPQPHKADVVLKAGKAVVRVAVTVAIKGARLEATPQTVDFGEVRKDTTPPPISVLVKNSGNDRATLTGWSGGGAEFILPTEAITIEPGAETKVDVVMKAGPAANAPVAATALPQTEKPTCGTAPALALKGQRVNQDVLVNPAGVEFDGIECTETPKDKREFTISNYAGSEVTFTAKLPADSLFTVTAPPVVAASTGPDAPGTAKISISGKGGTATLGSHVENLEVQLGPPASVTKTFPVKVDVSGAILEIIPATLENFAVGEEKSFGVRNIGNAPTWVEYSIAGNGFSVTDSDGGDYLLANVGDEIRVKFDASASGTYEASLKVQRAPHPLIFFRSARLCSPPPNLTLRATR